jgi:hypothetical protein
MTMHREIARGPGSPSSKVEALISAATAFDASAFEMLCRIQADLEAAVERDDSETVELLAAERRLHRETREILLQQAEAEIRRVDAGVILRDLLRAA